MILVMFKFQVNRSKIERDIGKSKISLSFNQPPAFGSKGRARDALSAIEIKSNFEKFAAFIKSKTKVNAAIERLFSALPDGINLRSLN